MKTCGSVVSFNYSYRSSPFQYSPKTGQCLDGIWDMLQYKTNEYMIKGFLRIGQMENIPFGKRNIREAFIANSFSCSAQGFLRDVNRGKSRFGIPPCQNHRLRPDPTPDLE